MVHGVGKELKHKSEHAMQRKTSLNIISCLQERVEEGNGTPTQSTLAWKSKMSFNQGLPILDSKFSLQWLIEDTD